MHDYKMLCHFGGIGTGTVGPEWYQLHHPVSKKWTSEHTRVDSAQV